MFDSDRSKLVRDMLEALEKGHNQFIQPTPLRRMIEKYSAMTSDESEGKIRNLVPCLFHYNINAYIR